MRHILSALVVNQPGVLAHISGMMASRAFNIDSLAVGTTENPEYSRMTFVVKGGASVLDQVRKQLEKILTVVEVMDYVDEDYVERELMLVKVSTPNIEARSRLKELVDIFRARIVDVGSESLMVEISGQEKKVQAFVESASPFGILEIARTGSIALARKTTMSVSESAADPTHKNQLAAK